MIHPVTDSRLRTALLRLVVIQRKLVEKLCALPVRSTVDLTWLQTQVWPTLDADWVARFWTNEKGRRQTWMKAIAAARQPEKDKLLDLMRTQHQFRGLYNSPGTVHMPNTDSQFWEASKVRLAMKKLILDFYDPWFGQSLGYPPSILRTTDKATKRAYVGKSLPAVCPYCDNGLRRAELDHFLPKSSFPFLSVHPDNLIPVCHDCNSWEQKGDEPPLNWGGQDQVADWFHPRFRSGNNRFTVSFAETSSRTPTVQLVAIAPADQGRVANMDRLFGLADFWGRCVETDIQHIQKEIADYFREAGSIPDTSTVRAMLQKRHRDHRRYIGHRERHIYWAALYEHAASSEAIINEAIQQYHQDANATDGVG